METTPICSQCGQPLPAGAPQGLCPGCLLKAGLPTGTQTQTCGSGFVPPEPSELARFFPQLEILSLIGRGGMGAVYRARQKQLDRLVALKILPPEVSQDPSFAERFVREAQALAKLTHPGIVTLYEFGQADGLFYFLMELVEGVNLGQLLAQRQLAPREALAIVPQICEALQYAHDRGIVHRDIKPANLLLNREGRVKIADFGVARMLASGAESAARTPAAEVALTQAGRVVGTPRYMAPEQVNRPLEVDHRADIYSLGVVFYQMLTGQLPAGPIEPPSRKVQIDVRLDEIVLRALEREPERRYQQASEVQTQLETLLTQPAASPGAGPDAAAVPSPPRWSPWALTGAAWIGLFVAASFLMYARAGWALMRGLRESLGVLAEVLVNVPAQLIVMLGPVGIPAVGWLALRQIRYARGRYRGLGLALLVSLVVPLVALNGWLMWLGSQAANQIAAWETVEGAGSALKALYWPRIVGIVLGLGASLLMLWWACRRVMRPLPALPSGVEPPGLFGWPVQAPQPLGVTLLRMGKRLGPILILNLLVIETVESGTVHWRESSQELLSLLLLPLSAVAILWVLWPALGQRRRVWRWLWSIAAVGAFIGLQAVNGFYYAHLRPNLGLYRESDWVARTGGWQRQYRLATAKRLWKRPTVAPFFSETRQVVLSLDETHPVRLLDLDSGVKTALEKGEVAELEAWARSNRLDLIVSRKEGRFTVAGLGLGIGFVPERFWPEDPPQNADDYFALERGLPRERVSLWPPSEYSHEVQGWPRSHAANQTPRAATYYFRTREGAVGLLHLTNSVAGSNFVSLTYKRVLPPGASRPGAGSPWRRPDLPLGHLE